MRAEREYHERTGWLIMFTGVGFAFVALLWELRWRRLLRILIEQKTTASQWVERALHDPLTGLPNRLLLQDRIEQALARAHRTGKHIALLCVDLDDFKTVNDNHGHLIGDQILIAVGQRFRQHLRASDTAARLGGDEFVILIDVSDSTDAVMLVAERLRSALQVPLLLEPEPLTLNVSIGVAIATSLDTTPDELLARADRALLRAKHWGKDRVVIASDDDAGTVSTDEPLGSQSH